MALMVYYYLRKGDYLQLGDEYETSDGWKPISDDWIGVKWGYDPNTGKHYNWARVRRLVPDTIYGAKVDSGLQEQWGEEFEIWGKPR